MAGLDMRRAPRMRTAGALLLLSCAALAVLCVVMRLPMADVLVYRAEGEAVIHGTDLYGFTVTSWKLPATYPPFAAMLFVPAGLLSLTATKVAFLVGNSLLLVLLVHLSLRLAYPGRTHSAYKRELPLLLTAAAAGLWLEPVFQTITFGQINLAARLPRPVGPVPRRGRTRQGPRHRHRGGHQAHARDLRRLSAADRTRTGRAHRRGRLRGHGRRGRARTARRQRRVLDAAASSRRRGSARRGSSTTSRSRAWRPASRTHPTRASCGSCPRLSSRWPGWCWRGGCTYGTDWTAGAWWSPRSQRCWSPRSAGRTTGCGACRCSYSWPRGGPARPSSCTCSSRRGPCGWCRKQATWTYV